MVEPRPRWITPGFLKGRPLTDYARECIAEAAKEGMKKVDSMPKLRGEIDQLRSAVDKMEKELAVKTPPPFFPLEMKQDLRRIIQRGIVKQKPINQIARSIKHYFEHARIPE
jgi:hypothetical protein